MVDYSKIKKRSIKINQPNRKKSKSYSRTPLKILTLKWNGFEIPPGIIGDILDNNTSPRVGFKGWEAYPIDVPLCIFDLNENDKDKLWKYIPNDYKHEPKEYLRKCWLMFMFYRHRNFSRKNVFTMLDRIKEKYSNEEGIVNCVNGYKDRILFDENEKRKQKGALK